MSDKAKSNIPGRITAPAEMLEAAVAELLRRIPDTWQAYRPDDLSETQAQALFLLTAAGMVERRERGRTRLVNHPVAIEFTFTATGEYGAVEALEKVGAAMWADWRGAYDEWRQGGAGGVSPFQTERLEPSEWRLTDQGVMAKQDLASGRQDVVFDFVLKRGFFDGRPRLLPDGRTCQREPVRGRGELLCMEKVRVDAAVTGTVNVGNWSEGADAFAAAFAGLFALTRPPAVLPGEAAPSGRKGKGRGNLRSWTQEDLDKAILEYKAARAATYADLREGLRKNSPVARKAAREVYGRNAIARALGVKSPSMVSKSPAWLAIAEDLGLELRRGRSRGTRHTTRPGKIGYEMALERKSATPAPGADNAPADEALESAERQETIRRINRLARSGRTAKEKADNQRAADELLRKLQCEECTDEQARRVVAMILNGNE